MLVDLAPADKNINQMENINVAKHKKRVLRNAGLSLRFRPRSIPSRNYKKIFEYKNVVVINSVEPHYFAGYTGGRKSFLPGVAGYETIEHNHSFALSEDSCALGLKGNPVNEDMIDSVK